MKVNVKLVFFKEVDSSTLLRRLIKWWTNSNYYHVEIVIDNLWVSAELSGVELHELRPLEDKYDYVDLNVDLSKEQYTALLKWVGSKDGIRYDYLGVLLSTILPARIDNPNKWFCSEIVVKILQLMLVEEVYDLTPNMITPGYLAKLYGVE